MFPKLSKLLNQEDALSAPHLQLLTGISQLRGPIKVARRGFALRGHSHGAGMLRTDVILRFVSDYRLRSPRHHANKRCCFSGGWRQLHG